jgi:hypothetical protein
VSGFDVPEYTPADAYNEPIHQHLDEWLAIDEIRDEGSASPAFLIQFRCERHFPEVAHVLRAGLGSALGRQVAAMLETKLPVKVRLMERRGPSGHKFISIAPTGTAQEGHGSRAPAAQGVGLRQRLDEYDSSESDRGPKIGQMCPVYGHHTVTGHESRDSYSLKCIIAQARAKGLPASLEPLAIAFDVTDWYGKPV